MLKINSLTAELVICGNTETLRPIWGDIYDDAGMEQTHDWDESVAVAWHEALTAQLWAAFDTDSEWKTESAFSYWHGGPGHGSYRLHEVDRGFPADLVSLAVAHADVCARAAARADVADLAACDGDA